MASLLLTLLFLAPMSLAGENSIILAESQRVLQRRMDTGDTRVLVNATQTDTVGLDFRAIGVDDNFNFYVSVTSNNHAQRKVFRISFFEEWARLPTTDDIAVILVGRYVVGLESDRQSGQLFGSDWLTHEILKMKPNGSDVEVVTTFEELPRDVVISGGFLYWNTRGYGARDNIFRCPTDDCSNPERLHDTDIDMYGYGLEVNGDCVIWADPLLNQIVVTNFLTGSQTRLMSHVDFVDVSSISLYEGALYYTDWQMQTLTVCYPHNTQCFNIMSGVTEPRDFEFTSPADDSPCSLLDDSKYSRSSTMNLDSSTMSSTMNLEPSVNQEIADGLEPWQKALIGVAAAICSCDLLVRLNLWISCQCCKHERRSGTGQKTEKRYLPRKNKETSGSDQRMEIYASQFDYDTDYSNFNSEYDKNTADKTIAKNHMQQLAVPAVPAPVLPEYNPIYYSITQNIINYNFNFNCNG